MGCENTDAEDRCPHKKVSRGQSYSVKAIELLELPEAGADKSGPSPWSAHREHASTHILSFVVLLPQNCERINL
jgi:hypothetical protein